MAKRGARKGQLTGRSLEIMTQVQNRRRQVLRDYLCGLTSVEEIAVRYGLDENTICNDVEYVRQKIVQDTQEQFKMAMELTLAQLDLGIREATNEWEKSKQAATKISTTTTPRRCPACKGSGWKNGIEEAGEWCDACGGDGKVESEVITREIKGQCGDPQFLALFKELLKEKAKLWDLYPKRRSKKEQQINTTTVNVIQGSGPFANASADDLLEAMGLIDRLQAGGQKVIDVESEPEVGE